MERPHKRPRLPTSHKSSSNSEDRHHLASHSHQPNDRLNRNRVLTEDEISTWRTEPAQMRNLCKVLRHVDHDMKGKGEDELTECECKFRDDVETRTAKLCEIIIAESPVNNGGVRYRTTQLRALIVNSYPKGHQESVSGAASDLDIHRRLTGRVGNKWIARVLTKGSAAYNPRYLEFIKFRSMIDQPTSTSIQQASEQLVLDSDTMILRQTRRDSRDSVSDENLHESESDSQQCDIRHTTETAASIQKSRSMSGQDPRASLVHAARPGDFDNSRHQRPSPTMPTYALRSRNVPDDAQSEGTLRFDSVRADESNDAFMIHPACIESLVSAIHLEEIIAATTALYNAITSTSDLLEGSGILGGDTTVCHVAATASPALDLIFQRATGLKEWRSRLRKHVREGKLGRDILSMSLWSRFLFDEILAARHPPDAARVQIECQAHDFAEEMYDVLQAHIKLNLPVHRSASLSDTLVKGFESMCEMALKLKALCLATEGVYSWNWPGISDNVVTNKMMAVSRGTAHVHSNNDTTGQPELILVVFPALLRQATDEEGNPGEDIMFRARVATA